MRLIKKYLLTEYTIVLFFLLLAVLNLFSRTLNHDLYFRVLGDPSQKLVWYPASLLIKNMFFTDFSFLWSPLFGAGVPFLADPSLGAFLPYRIFLFLDPNIYVVIILLTAGFFTYLFSKTIGIGKGGAFLASICFMLNTYFVQYINHSQLEVDALLPLVLLFFYLTYKKQNYTTTSIAGIIFSLSIFGMSPESTFYILFVVFTFLIFLMIRDLFTKQSNCFKGLLHIFIALIIGLALTSYQVFPLYEYLRGHALNYRSLDRGLVHNPLSDLNAIISSEFYFRFNWVYTPFVGVEILFLFIVLGVFSAIHKPSIKKFSFIFCAFLLIGICYGYLNKFFHSLPIPFFKEMANEKHPIPAIAFCLAMIGGYGLDYIIKSFSNRITKIAFFVLITLAASTELFDYFANEPVRAGFGKISLNQPPDYSVFINKDKDIFRIYASPRDGYLKGNFYSPVAGNNVEIFNISNISFDTAYFSYRYHKYFVDLLKGESQCFTTSINSVNSFNSPFFDLLNVKYVVGMAIPALSSLNPKKYSKVYDKDNLQIFKNNYCLPRAFMVYKAKYLTTETKTLAYLNSNEFNPRNTIVIESNDKFDLSTKQLNNNNVSIISYKPTEVNLNVNTSESGFLFLSDMYFPGWKAYVNGKATKIYRANYLFRSIYLSTGQYHVRFVYKPLTFVYGLMVTILTLLLILILILYSKGILKTKITIILSIGYLFSTVLFVILFYIYHSNNIDPFLLNNKPFEYNYKYQEVNSSKNLIKLDWSGKYAFDPANNWYVSPNKGDSLSITFKGKALKLKILSNTNCGTSIIRLNNVFLTNFKTRNNIDILGEDVLIDDEKGSVTGIPNSTYINTYNSTVMAKELSLLKKLPNNTRFTLSIETVKPLIVIYGVYY